MAFKRGGQAAEKAAKDAQKNFSRITYFKLDDGDRMTVRLLDDSPEWIYTKQHSFVDTKGAPEDVTGKDRDSWPVKMGATCRKDECIGADTCYICDQMTNAKGKPITPATRLWARAVVREEVIGTEKMADDGLITPRMVGRVVGHMDAEHDVEETDHEGKATGNKIRQKKIVLINMGIKNFFGSLQAYFDSYQTVLDRDYRITRSGTGLDSEYRITACDKDPEHDLDANENLRAKYESFAKAQGLSVEDVEKMILDKGSEEFYARFFDPTVKAPPRKKKDEADDKSAAKAAEPRKDDEDRGGSYASYAEPDEAELAVMRDRVRTGGRKTTSE